MEPSTLRRLSPALPRIGAVIITRNEEKNLERCLATLGWLDEIVVVDDCSSDRTVEIASHFGCRVIVHPLRHFANQRNLGLEAATADWIFHIDADEECTPELAREIRRAAGSSSTTAFRIPIRNRFLGKVMRGRDWTRLRGIRLGRRGSTIWREPIHERLHVTGSVGELKHWLEHHGETDYTHRVIKSNRYTSFQAERLQKRGVHFTIWRLLVIPTFCTLKSYLLSGGWRDGVRGLIWAGHVWWGNFAIYVKLWDLDRLQQCISRTSARQERASRKTNVADAAR